MLEIFDTAWSFRGTLSKRGTTDTIVLHHRAGEGDAKSLHEAHLKNGWQGIGYHFYVRRDGTVYRGRPIECVGAHVSGHNDHTIGVCFEGNFEKERMNDRQLEQGSELICHIQEGYGGGLKVACHRDFLPTACPGAYFPFDRMTHRAEAYFVADMMYKDGVISEKNIANWRMFLSGDALSKSDYVKKIIQRYQFKIRR